MTLPQPALKDSQEQGTQIQRAYKAFSQPRTMLEVSKVTGVRRANICRYVAKWRKVDQITRIRTGICSVSKYPAGRYSNDQGHA